MRLARPQMSVSTAILALVLYPVLYILFPSINWVRFQWGFRQGLAQMPPDVRAKAEAADRAVAAFIHALLLVIVVLLLRGSSISADDVGLSSANWSSATAFGALLGFVTSFVLIGMLRSFAAGKPQEGAKWSDSLAVNIGMAALSTFSHEFWRAFCIVALIRVDVAAWIAVLVTAVAFGSLLLHKSTMIAVGAAFYGALAGFAFVKTGSLLAPVAMGLVGSGTNFYWERYERPRAAQKPALFRCPACSQAVERTQQAKDVQWFPCSNCGEKLKVMPPNWPATVGGLILAVLALDLLDLGVFWSLVLFVPLFLFLTAVSAVVILGLLPQFAEIEIYRDPHERHLFRF
jgi:hypothetical protein